MSSQHQQHDEEGYAIPLDNFPSDINTDNDTTGLDITLHTTSNLGQATSPTLSPQIRGSPNRSPQINGNNDNQQDMPDFKLNQSYSDDDNQSFERSGVDLSMSTATPSQLSLQDSFNQSLPSSPESVMMSSQGTFYDSIGGVSSNNTPSEMSSLTQSTLNNNQDVSNDSSESSIGFSIIQSSNHPSEVMISQSLASSLPESTIHEQEQHQHQHVLHQSRVSRNLITNHYDHYDQPQQQQQQQSPQHYQNKKIQQKNVNPTQGGNGSASPQFSSTYSTSDQSEEWEIAKSNDDLEPSMGSPQNNNEEDDNFQQENNDPLQTSSISSGPTPSSIHHPQTEAYQPLGTTMRSKDDTVTQQQDFSQDHHHTHQQHLVASAGATYPRRSDAHVMSLGSSHYNHQHRSSLPADMDESLLIDEYQGQDPNFESTGAEDDEGNSLYDSFNQRIHSSNHSVAHNQQQQQQQQQQQPSQPVTTHNNPTKRSSQYQFVPRQTMQSTNNNESSTDETTPRNQDQSMQPPVARTTPRKAQYVFVPIKQQQQQQQQQQLVAEQPNPAHLQEDNSNDVTQQLYNSQQEHLHRHQEEQQQHLLSSQTYIDVDGPQNHNNKLYQSSPGTTTLRAGTLDTHRSLEPSGMMIDDENDEDLSSSAAAYQHQQQQQQQRMNNNNNRINNQQQEAQQYEYTSPSKRRISTTSSTSSQLAHTPNKNNKNNDTIKQKEDTTDNNTWWNGFYKAIQPYIAPTVTVLATAIAAITVYNMMDKSNNKQHDSNKDKRNQ